MIKMIERERVALQKPRVYLEGDAYPYRISRQNKYQQVQLDDSHEVPVKDLCDTNDHIYAIFGRVCLNIFKGKTNSGCSKPVHLGLEDSGSFLNTSVTPCCYYGVYSRGGTRKKN